MSSDDSRQMIGPGGVARTGWATELLRKAATSRTGEARSALDRIVAEEQAVLHLLSKLKEAECRAADAERRVEEAERQLASMRARTTSRIVISRD